MAAILSSILVILRRTKPVFKLEREFDGSYQCMKSGRNPNKMTKNDHDNGQTDRWTYEQKTSNIKALCFVVSDKRFFSC